MQLAEPTKPDEPAEALSPTEPVRVCQGAKQKRKYRKRKPKTVGNYYVMYDMFCFFN